MANDQNERPSTANPVRGTTSSPERPLERIPIRMAIPNPLGDDCLQESQRPEMITMLKTSAYTDIFERFLVSMCGASERIDPNRVDVSHSQLLKANHDPLEAIHVHSDRSRCRKDPLAWALVSQPLRRNLNQRRDAAG